MMEMKNPYQILGVPKTATSLSDLKLKQEQEKRTYIANTLKICRSKRHVASRLGIGESRLRFLLNQMKIEA